MRWWEMEGVQPRLAALGRRRLLEPDVVLVATIRKDRTPRVSPGGAPFVMDGILWLPMLWHTRKPADLLRDPRILMQSMVAGSHSGEGEFKIRSTAGAEQGPGVQRRSGRALDATEQSTFNPWVQSPSSLRVTSQGCLVS